MSRFVALLRGVNIGGGNRVPMAELRSILTSLGHSQVATLLNSGNAVFTASESSTAKHGEQIRAALRDSLAVDVPVIIKSSEEMVAVRAECPFQVEEQEHSRLLLGFAADPTALAKLADLPNTTQSPEPFHINSHALYLLCQDGVSKSKIAGVLMGKRCQAITTRNWATVLKLCKLVESP